MLIFDHVRKCKRLKLCKNGFHASVQTSRAKTYDATVLYIQRLAYLFFCRASHTSWDMNIAWWQRGFLAASQ